ncbi:MAG TPA: hypothetical protein VFX78_00705 [Candidatus Eisenbacteria bacterium]|nr:hypothetical protein [Candidatus Eisenbacteria bacterium]
MSFKSWAFDLLLVARVLACPAAQAFAAPSMFYVEVPKDGQIYVFAVGERFASFEKSGSEELGEPAIIRHGYGPNGETVVFDSEDAINLYNFKHDLPGEYFPAGLEPKSPFPKGTFSGQMFGDYYKYDEWHADQIGTVQPTTVKEQHGFWMRRIYFTYDLAFSEKLTTRFRLEANSSGQFVGGNLETFIKDAYLKWTYEGKHAATLGIHPSLTFGWLEGFWGLRHVEKMPADLYRLDSSRDFGISFSGPLAIEGLEYAAQYGNESGTGSEIDRYKIVRFESRYERTPGIALEVLYSRAQRPDGQDRSTAQGFAGYRNEVIRLGAQYLWQERELIVPGPADQEIEVWSGFVVWDVLPKKADLFARLDRVEGDLDGVETGLPGAATIDYLLLSPESPFKTWIVGGEWYILPSIRVGANVELVKYDHDPDPVNFPGRDETRLYRLNFFWTF